MNKLLFTLSFLISLICFTSQSWASPRLCPPVHINGSCMGIKEFSDGFYWGYLKNDKPHGQGTYTYANGTIKEGIWEDGKFEYEKKPYKRKLYKIDQYKSFCSEIGFTPGTEKFGELRSRGNEKRLEIK